MSDDVVRLRFTYTKMGTRNTAVIDTDGHRIGCIEFDGADASDLFQAFLMRLARSPDQS